MTENPNLPARRDEDTRLDLGSGHLDASDLILPRIKVVQQMSAEANSDPKKADPGDFFNTLDGSSYGKSLRFIPLHPFKQRVFLAPKTDEKRAKANAALVEAGLEALGEGDGLLCRSLDMYQGIGDPGILCSECPLSKWDGQVPPLCSETYNVAAITELGELIILSFAKSSAKTGKRVFSMIRLKGVTSPPWANTYEATTQRVTNEKGTFFVPDVVVAGPTPTELLNVAAKVGAQIAGVQIDVTPVDEEAEAEAPAPF